MRIRMKIAVVSVVLVLLAGFVLAEPLPAQDDRPTLELTPVVGGGFYLNDLATWFNVAPLPAEGFEAERRFSAGLENSLAVGLRIGFPVSSRLTAEIEGLLSDTQFDAAFINRRGELADLHLLLVGGSVRYAFPANADAIRPFVVGGAGVKRYDSPDSIREMAETDFMGSIGGGVMVLVGLGDLVVEVRDYMSSFGSHEGGNFQHDLMVTGGLTVGVL